MKTKTATYFDDEGRQLRPYPEKVMVPGRFKVGDRVEYIGKDNCRWTWGSLSGRVGIVTEVHAGWGPYPSELRRDEDYDFWVGQHPARLTVDFGPECVFGHMRRGKQEIPDTRRSLELTEEGDTWRLVKRAK